MAIDLITVHAAKHGYAFTMTFADDETEPYVRQATTAPGWDHDEAVNRALSVGRLYGLTADEIAGIDKPAARPVIARHDGHDCTACGIAIPATGGRGRPRKIHVECAEKIAAEKAAKRKVTV